MATEMEEDIFERAFIHWKEKRKMKIIYAYKIHNKILKKMI